METLKNTEGLERFLLIHVRDFTVLFSFSWRKKKNRPINQSDAGDFFFFGRDFDTAVAACF